MSAVDKRTGRVNRRPAPFVRWLRSASSDYQEPFGQPPAVPVQVRLTVPELSSMTNVSAPPFGPLATAVSV